VESPGEEDPVKRRPLVIASVSIALAVVASLGSNAGAAGSSQSASAVPVVLPASALAPIHRAGGMRPPIGYLPLHAREFAAAKAAANARAGVTGKAGTAVAAGGAVVSSYENVSPSFDGIYRTDSTPPDTTGAIGPDRYIEAVNTAYGIFNRSGTLLDSGDLSSLTGVPTGLFGYALSDPQVMWDAKTQRFYYAAVYYDPLFFSDNGIAFGFSTTATPAGAGDFCRYALGYGGELPDYPKLGDSSDFLLFGANNFGTFASTYDGSSFAIVNKPRAGATCPDASTFSVHGSGVLHNVDGSLAATPVPANLVDDANGTGYVVANADLSTTPSAAFVSVYSVTTVGVDANGIPVPAVSGPRNVSVTGYAMPASAPQQDSADLLDTLDGRFEAAVAAVDPGHGNAIGLWTAHAVFGGGGVEERWYEIDANGGALLQSGKVSSPSLSVWNGAISPDRANTGASAAFGANMAMSVSTSSATSYPAIQFVTKSGTSAQSTLTNLVQASGPNIDFSCDSSSPCRWGDYSGASPDPAATGAGKVWLVNQYNLAGGTSSSASWRTRIFGVTPASTSPPNASLTFATPAQALTAGQASAPMQVGVTVAQPGDVAVSVASNSANGQFATSTSGPWSSTLQVTITAGQTASPAFYYSDSHAGTATLTASASGFTSVTQTETVAAAPLQTMTVSPSNASLTVGGSQTFTASGTDAFGNAVSVAGANWTTTAPGSLSATNGTSTTFTAAAAGSGLVRAASGSVSASASVTVASQTISAPTGVTATQRGKRLQVSWQPVAGAAAYNIYRGTAPGGESATPYARGLTNTSYNDGAVTKGTTYYYRVSAVAANGTESNLSAEVSATAR
jgi:hypothetical protein